MGPKIQLELTRDEALVLFEFLARFQDHDALSIEDRSEELALCSLHALLERQLAEPLDPAYRALVEAARGRMRDPA